MIDWLEDQLPPYFPPSSTALKEPNGLLAAGGDLSSNWLKLAYNKGIFPWYEEDDPILWWTPAPRAIITKQSYKKPRTVRKTLNRLERSRNQAIITRNQAFRNVVLNCAQPRKDQAGTWITTDIQRAYLEMHKLGYADSFELWDEFGNLIGGLYGLRFGSVFFGESMFSKSDNASKITFSYAADILFASGATLIDCQMQTEHLAQFGAHEVNRNEFEQLLNNGLNNNKPELPVVIYPR